MEKEPFENSPESEGRKTLEKIAGDLGLVETEGMKELRSQIVELIKGGKDFKYPYSQYEDLAIGIVEQYRDEAFKKAQIAHLILEASIFQEAEDTEGYKEKIGQALEYACGMHWEDIEDEIILAK